MDIKIKKNAKHMTKTVDGRENGYLIPILNVHDGFLPEEDWPKQVYCTVAFPGEIKGPHLHKKRSGLFTCVKGNVKIVIRTAEGEYIEEFSGENYNYTTIQVPRGIPSALVNLSDTEDAYVLNMPNPSWHPDDQDDWDVTFDDYDFGK